MTNQQEQPNTMEPLEPAYEALQQRLLDDGAAWRAGLPSTERLEQRLNALARQGQGAKEHNARPAAEASERRSRLRLINETKGDSSVFHGRLRTIAAVATIAAVVALFAVLFYGFAGHGTQTGSTSPQVSRISSKDLPVIAPNNPRVIYKLVPVSPASTQVALARSDDGGATWHTFAVPAGKSSDLLPPYVFVSPLDARAVFLITIPASYPASDTTASCPQSQAFNGGLNSYAAFSGGQIPCPVVYLSQDGGAHWVRAHLPQAGRFVPEAPGPMDTSPTNGITSSADVFRPQGSRLYSVMGVIPTRDGISGFGVSGHRLITSTDGGLTWSFADSGLPSDNGGLCEYSPAPAGLTIFAAVCGSVGSAATASLWRSDDAGAHWAQVGRLPDNTVLGMAVVTQSDGAQPLLYINMAQSICTINPYIASQPHAGVCNYDASPANLQVSADGGKTWQAAPAKGYPDMKLNPGAPLGVLHNGAVLFFVNDQLFAWKAGDASWQQVGASLFGGFRYALVSPAGADGKQTVSVVVNNGSEYIIQSFAR